MAGFTVNWVQERQSLGAGNRIQQMTVVHLTTYLGNTGTVELPTDNYLALTNTDEGRGTLKGILEEKADSLDAPMSL